MPVCLTSFVTREVFDVGFRRTTALLVKYFKEQQSDQVSRKHPCAFQ